MSVKKFRISTRNSGRYRTVWICVYDTVEEMRKAGMRHDTRMGFTVDPGYFDKAYGLTQSFQVVLFDEDGKVAKRRPGAGFIRLFSSELRTGIISHEATHMAVAIYQQDVARTIPDMKREERLCYLVGDITSKIVNGLYKLKLL